MHVEQAIFTSVRRRGREGYQLVAASSGVSADARRELGVWGPSHDSLLTESESASSVNFHSLSTGTICVSRTMTAGSEYSGRGGWRVYTHSLLMTPGLFERFGSHPLRFLEAVEARGALRPMDPVPSQLEPLPVVGRAATMDVERITGLLAQYGGTQLQSLLNKVLDGQSVGIIGPDAQTLITGLLDLVPPSCRAELSFSTGLKYSPRRPFRLFSCTADPAQQCRIGRKANVLFHHMDRDHEPQARPPCEWADWVHDQLIAGRFDQLDAGYAEIAGEGQMSDLNDWARRFRHRDRANESAASAPALEAAADDSPSGTATAHVVQTNNDPQSFQIPHQPHPNRGQRSDATAVAPLDSSADRKPLPARSHIRGGARTPG